MTDCSDPQCGVCRRRIEDPERGGVWVCSTCFDVPETIDGYVGRLKRALRGSITTRRRVAEEVRLHLEELAASETDAVDQVDAERRAPSGWEARRRSPRNFPIAAGNRGSWSPRRSSAALLDLRTQPSNRHCTGRRRPFCTYQIRAPLVGVRPKASPVNGASPTPRSRIDGVRSPRPPQPESADPRTHVNAASKPHNGRIDPRWRRPGVHGIRREIARRADAGECLQ